ncbi:hypothetical protein SteCoe_20909 [Stentor coeruleus]|uniref:Uncharacterized protein n=1 Tax=Stentor coeruleus TaxID=5963 RepID=A0A1R2BQU0_9CILI|nr:hypothetical protein SteCoe_20909 [Stentor coeruleus]
MYSAKRGCEEVEKWNCKAKTLVQELESTIEGFSKLFDSNKENNVHKVRKFPVKVFQILTDTNKRENKADPMTIQRIIRAGIYNLRKSSSPMITANQTPVACQSCRCSSIEPRRPTSSNLIKKHPKKKKKILRGKSQEKKKIQI